MRGLPVRACYILGEAIAVVFVGVMVVTEEINGQQLISLFRKKCPTSSEASLKKQFCHFVSQLGSFSIASLATGLALT